MREMHVCNVLCRDTQLTCLEGPNINWTCPIFLFGRNMSLGPWEFFQPKCLFQKYNQQSTVKSLNGNIYLPTPADPAFKSVIFLDLFRRI